MVSKIPKSAGPRFADGTNRISPPMFPKSLWAALLIASPATMLEAEPGVVVSYDMLPRLVRAQNPELTAARVRIREALARSAKAGRHANPELETSVEQNSRFREWKAEIGFTQRFPVTDRLRLEREIGLTEVKAAEAEVREVERHAAHIQLQRNAFVDHVGNKALAAPGRSTGKPLPIQEIMPPPKLYTLEIPC